jgi:uncharacterized PurR-regulated membrane protein YhhQ (DUF165 family)
MFNIRVYGILINGEKQVLAICLINYTYKFSMAIILTPLIYFINNRIENYLGHETAMKMKLIAMGKESS